MRRRPLETRTWIVMGNATLDVAPVAVELIRLTHDEQDDPSWVIESTGGDSWEPMSNRKADVRAEIANALRHARYDVREQILDTAADHARTVLETLIERGDALKALAMLGGMPR